jgi:hypothetical protein
MTLSPLVLEYSDLNETRDDFIAILQKDYPDYDFIRDEWSPDIIALKDKGHSQCRICIELLWDYKWKDIKRLLGRWG